MKDLSKFFKKELEVFLKEHDIRPHISIDRQGRGETYTLKTKQAVMSITVGDRWLGYVLSINKDVYGQSIDSALDTDNYTLGGDNERFSLEVFAEILRCTQALVDSKIYAGKTRGRTLLAIPRSDEDYLLISRRRFTSSKKLIGNSEIKGDPFLHPVH